MADLVCIAPETGDATCVVCGKGFRPKGKARCCSTECAWRQSQATRSANARTRRARTCERCGEPFTARNPSGRARKGRTKEGRFCSIACRGAAQSKPAVPKPCSECRAPIAPRRRSVCSAECATLRRRRLHDAKQGRDRAPRTCRECGTLFVPHWGSWRRDCCSAGCGRKAPRRVAKARRRARVRLAEVERLDPLAVFERDGWRCHLCGRRTLARLRGTSHPRAPELDHIQPLALGGAHSSANTACACRQCNGAKGARTLGQPSLLAVIAR